MSACAPQRLRSAERRYRVNAFSNTYVYDLTMLVPASSSDGAIEIVTDRSVVEDLFVSTSVAGFAAQVAPRPRLLLEALARIAIARPDTSLYAARCEGAVAGTAGMSILETGIGKVAHLYIASTLPAYRGGCSASIDPCQVACSEALGMLISERYCTSRQRQCSECRACGVRARLYQANLLQGPFELAIGTTCL